ncbi:kinase-like domain-containing protein [Aspergillus germanicus]
MELSELLAAEEDTLIEFCSTAPKAGRMIGGHVGGDHVGKLSDNTAVKYGLGVSYSEAAAQSFAYEGLHPDIVHVPKVHRFFISSQSGDPVGYLFMEYISGRTPTDDDLNLDTENGVTPRIAIIITLLGTLRGSTPGPPDGGCPRGYIFGDDGANAPFSSIEDMNAYMNRRLEYRKDTIDLSTHPLVFCHGDICRRNIILEDDGSICLVDWGYARFYPRFCELLALSFVTPDNQSPAEVEAYHESLKKAFSSSRPPTIEATNLPTADDAAAKPRSDGKEEPNTQELADDQ